MSRGIWGVAALFVLVAFPFYADYAEADFTVKGQVVAAGGDAGAGAWQVNGTLGQPAVGTGTKLFRMVCSGFWCFGGTRIVSVDDGPGGEALPAELAFGAPMPNPSPGVVHFTLALPAPATVALAVFDVAGRQVGEPVSRRLEAGWHRLEWSAPTGRPGVYFGRLSVEGNVRFERRIVLVR
jgi:hypothetical protein